MTDKYIILSTKRFEKIENDIHEIKKNNNKTSILMEDIHLKITALLFNINKKGEIQRNCNDEKLNNNIKPDKSIYD